MTQPGPICNLCTTNPRPSWHGLSVPVPAHTMDSRSPATCRRCLGSVNQGDQYLCHEGPDGAQDGICHLSCPPTAPLGALNASADLPVADAGTSNEEDDRG